MNPIYLCLTLFCGVLFSWDLFLFERVHQILVVSVGVSGPTRHINKKFSFHSHMVHCLMYSVSRKGNKKCEGDSLKGQTGKNRIKRHIRKWKLVGLLKEASWFAFSHLPHANNKTHCLLQAKHSSIIFLSVSCSLTCLLQFFLTEKPFSLPWAIALNLLTDASFLHRDYSTKSFTKRQSQ